MCLYILSLELINDHWYLIDSGGETHKNLVRERDSDAVGNLRLVSRQWFHAKLVYGDCYGANHETSFVFQQPCRSTKAAKGSWHEIRTRVATHAARWACCKAHSMQAGTTILSMLEPAANEAFIN